MYNNPLLTTARLLTDQHITSGPNLAITTLIYIHFIPAEKQEENNKIKNKNLKPLFDPGWTFI
jgi:hypothetical protein